MIKRNYQKELDEIINENQQNGKIPSLLIHSCCAPCSSYVLEYLSQYFFITLYYYNPNIYPPSEYERREQEQIKLVENMKFVHPVQIRSGVYQPDVFYQTAKGLEQEPEGGERCFQCYRLRLQEAARAAASGGYDYYTTTLTISPHKNADKVNEIGEQTGKEFGVCYLQADFKKRDGYKRSLELSAEYGLYRQNYCGCVYSMNRE